MSRAERANGNLLLVRDVRHAARALRNRPWISVFVILVLGFGLGSAVAVYSLIDAVFIRPLPVPQASELYAAKPAEAAVVNRLSRGTVARLEALLPPSSVAAFSSGAHCTVWKEGGDPARVDARLVNGSFFAALHLEPAYGRLLFPLDDQAGAANPVVVVSYAWAKDMFGSPADALGRRITVNQRPVTVVGVLPPAFRGVVLGQNTDLWFATAMQPQLHPALGSSESVGDDRPNLPDWNREERVSWVQLLVRTPSGQTPPQAALERAWAAERDDVIRSEDDPTQRERLTRRAWHFVRAPGGLSRFRDGFSSTGWLLSGVVAAMLLLVCTNAAGLLLVRSMSRYRELGIRLAIGAAAHQIARLVLVEALLLSVAGGSVGWLFASWLLPVLLRVLAPGQGLAMSLDGRSLLVMGAIALLVACASALLPALWIARIQPLRALSGRSGVGSAPLRVGRILVVAQFVIAVVLVTIAAAMGRALQSALEADPGFAREGVVTARFDPVAAGFGHATSLLLITRLKAAAQAVAGVEDVGFSSSGILTGNRSSSSVYFRTPAAAGVQNDCQHDEVSAGYFKAVGAQLLLGREFREGDAAAAPPVAIVSASLARSAFGSTNPVGQRIGFSLKPSNQDYTVVGVVADMRLNGVRDAAPAGFYLPLAQMDERVPEFVAVRFAGPPGPMIDQVRTAFKRAQPDLLFSQWMTLKDRMADDVSGDVATARLAYVFGGGAVLLAAIGVAASLGYLVILRQRELALRIAVGAVPAQLLRSVLADAARLSGIGALIGLGLIWAASWFPFARSVFFLSAVFTPALAAALVVMAASLLAAWMPARRASQCDPYLLLKAE